MRPSVLLSLRASCKKYASLRLSTSPTHFITPIYNTNNIHKMSTSTQQDASKPKPSDSNPASITPEPKQPLPLPEPTSEASTKIGVNGQGVKLDHLGPLVVNKDGSLSRITNWANMAEIERQNTLRILGKRNQLRTASLKEREGEEGK